MADPQDAEEIVGSAIERGESDNVERAMRRPAYEPSYRMRGDSKVPVSKSHGKLWKSRYKQAKEKRKRSETDVAWDEAIRYYRNDQIAYRYDGEGNYARNEGLAEKMGRQFSETENVVFANTSALVPALYAKNPTIECTANDPDDEEMVQLCEQMINVLMSKRGAPGLNIKPKARKAVVMCTLTNCAYMEVGYTFKENSSEQAMTDLRRLGNDLAKAKSSDKIAQLEGEIEALEQRIDMLRPAGPWVKFRSPYDVLVDPDAVEDDNDDAKWMMVCDYVSTEFINAVYGKRTKDSDQVKSIYKSTHVLKQGASGEEGHNDAESEIINYTMLEEDDKDGMRSAGYDDEDSYLKAQRTKVWYVWDKVTQRVYMYNDKDWSWPIWVWDNPYNLQSFFPLFKLQFYTDPTDTTGKGEVTYYLDQQDAINGINSEFKQARQWARRNLFYDKNKISKDEVEKYIKGDEDIAVGVDIPEGMTLKDAVFSMVPPSMQFIQLFDKKPILEAIDRVSSVQPVMRGVEFKTNTTNQAINAYNSTQQTRLDEKIDAVEDMLGKVGWAVLQMCLQFMPAETVATLVGEKRAQTWTTMAAEEIVQKLQMTLVGGSTQKPTSEAKKQMALQMGQVLGQFVNAAPGPVLMVMLSSLKQAFGDLPVSSEQWKSIMDAVMQAGAGQGAPGGEAGAKPQGPPQGAPQEAGGSGMSQAVAQIETLIQSLPPEAQQALGAAMAQGAPISKALQAIMQQIQQQPQGNA